MMWSHRRRRVALVVSTVATAATLAAFGTGAATGTDPDATIHIDYTATVTESGGGISLTLSWEETYDGSFNELYFGRAKLTSSLRGVVSYTQDGGQVACTANLTLLPSQTNQGAVLIPPGVTDAKYHLQLNRPSQPFVSDGAPGTRCATTQTYEGSHFWDDQYYPGAYDRGAWEAAAEPKPAFTPSAQRKIETTTPFKNAQFTASSSVEFSGLALGQGSTTPPSFGPPAPRPLSPQVKRAALAAARQQVGPAIVSCLTLGAGAVVYGALGANPVGVTTGATMVAVAAPICAREVAATRRLLDTYADPPVGSYTVLAAVPVVRTPRLALPKCRGISVCATLQKDVKTWVTAVQHVADVSEVLAVTAGRRTAAQTAGDVASTNAQAKHALELLPRLTSALKSQTGAEKAVASALRSIGMKSTLSEQQKRKALALVRTKVARPASQSALGTAPAGRDVLQLLSG